MTENGLSPAAAQEQLLAALIPELHRTGYTADRLSADYEFADYFDERRPVRTARLVGFAHVPASYDTACVAVAVSNGAEGVDVVRQHRALGAPMLFEVGPQTIDVWRVSPEPAHGDRRLSFTLDQISRGFEEYRASCTPLRARIFDTYASRKNGRFREKVPERLRISGHELVFDERDLLIVSTAIQYNLVLALRDEQEGMRRIVECAADMASGGVCAALRHESWN